MLAKVPATLIFYESTRRLTKTLHDMHTALGDRPAAIGRELTKLHEEIKRSTLSQLAAHFENTGSPKGEIVIIVGPPIKKIAPTQDKLDELILKHLKTKSVRDVSAELAIKTGLSKRNLYIRAIKLSELRGN